MNKKLSTVDARKNFAEIINQVAYGNQSIVLTRRGKDIAAIISTSHLKLLEQIEEKIDIEDAKKAINETGNNVSAKEVWNKLRI